MQELNLKNPRRTMRWIHTKEEYQKIYIYKKCKNKLKYNERLPMRKWRFRHHRKWRICVNLKLNGSLHLGHAVLKISFILLSYFLITLSQSHNTMSGRQSNKLPSNLPQLQNLIKRDPQSYVDEVGGVRSPVEAFGKIYNDRRCFKL